MNLLRPFFLIALLVTPCAASSDSVVVFNEIFYNPLTESQVEWIELHNQMSVDVDLSRWSLDGGIDFAFPEGTVIAGGGYLVIAADPDAIAGALGPFTGRLDNGGETLRLNSASGRLMNRVRYRDGGDWPDGADGSGATLAKVHRDSAASEAENWSWSGQVGGTPGAVNFPDDTAPSRALRINEIAGESETEFWIEIVNSGSTDVPLADHMLVQSTTGVTHVFGQLSLAPGAFLTLTADIFPGGAASGDKLFLYEGLDKQRLVDAAEVKTRARGRVPDGHGAFVFTAEDSPDAKNVLVLNTDIVINEILYHHPPQYADGNVPFAEVDREWIELYHRGDVAVDLTGWRLDGDIEYTFPEGTVLNPDGFVVVVGGDAGFAGNLPNGSGHVQLRDAHNNLVDVVRYFDDGDWPEAADGGGASLELRDPRADNANPLAWAASDESARTEWQEISYRGVAERSRVGPDNQWNEFVIGLLDDGEILIDDIRVIEDPDGKQIPFINNSSFTASIFGGGPLRNWRLLGNHRHGEIVPDPDDAENNVLRLVSTGSTEHMHNHVEITFASGARVTNGETYEIRFRARPVSGSPQILTRLYFSRLARTTILRTPTEIGTPGAPNSRREDNIGPTLSGLSHSPVVPTAEQSGTISLHAEDPDGVAELNLLWRANGGEFQEVPMTAADGAGNYSAVIPPQAADSVVQFYVVGMDGSGAVSQYPARGPASRALYQVLEPERLDDAGRLNAFRIIMDPDDTEWMHEAINLMSNDRVPATVIYKETEIFYNVGVRLKGSERGRVTQPRLGFNVGFSKQQPFRGIHSTVAVDRSEGVNFGQFEILFNQMMTHSGSIPAEYNDLIHVISPQDRHTGAAELQLARYGDVFLDSQFENGSDGNLYEYELIYFPTTDDANGYKRPNPDSVVGSGVRDLGDDPEDYRWIFLLKNNRKRNDFAPVMRYAKLFSLSNEPFQAALPELVDVDRWLQGMALALLSGSGDQYGANSQHNGMFYQRPDGKFIFFPHDLDFAHNASRSITENSDLRKIIQNPAYERMYLAHVKNIIATTFNESYMTRWANHFGELLPGQRFSTTHLNYVIARSRSAQSQINNMAPQVSFSIQTGGGQSITVDALSAEIEGTGDLNLHRLIHVETGAVYVPEWLDLERWKVRLNLEPGENVFTLQGVDVLGGTGSIFSPVGRGNLTITSTAAPVEPGAESVRGFDVTLDGATTAVLSYERSVVDGLRVTPELSDDLENWVEIADVTEWVAALEDGAFESVTLRFPIEPGLPWYARLRVERE